MTLQKRIEKSITEEANKLIQRHHAYHNALEIEHRRKLKRAKGVEKKEVRTPPCWETDKKFNPFYVHKHRKQIANSITNKIRSGTYKPYLPETTLIPKSSGGKRVVTIYQIPDAAVSRLFFQQLLKKNKHRFSSFSYAYRNDRNVHFAIQDIAFELGQTSRVFVAEFDFSQFFDSIELLAKLSSPAELTPIKA